MMLNSFVGLFVWWVLGYAFAFGAHRFIGFDNYFFLMGIDKNYTLFVFHACVAIFATTIVSGAAGERMHICAWTLVSVIFSGFIYPACIHWDQTPEWLHTVKYHDLAGSGFLHLSAGTCALILLIFLKPRADRYVNRDLFLPYNPTFVALGALILYPCWLFLHTGFKLEGETNEVRQGMIAANTLIAGSASAVVAFFLHYLIKKQYSIMAISNGLLVGLVAVSGDCDNILTWEALLFGIAAAVAYIIFIKVLESVQVDDPVQVVPVHFAGGLVGTLLTGLFDLTDGLFTGHKASLLGGQIVGIFIYIAFPGAIFALVLSVVKGLGLLRINDEVENQGIDIS